MKVLKGKYRVYGNEMFVKSYWNYETFVRSIYWKYVVLGNRTYELFKFPSAFLCLCMHIFIPLQWLHNERDGVSNHQLHDCLLNCLFRRRSKKTSKLLVTGLCEGNSPVTGGFPYKWPVTRKMFPFDDVIMYTYIIWTDHLCTRIVMLCLTVRMRCSE